MCLLVKVAANTEFPFAWFADCYDSNPDGVGISWVDADGVVQVKKALPASASEAFFWWINQAPKDVDYAMHWRMRTHGAVDVERVHPYEISSDLWLMHNGILSIKGDTTLESDTQIYARTYGKALGPVVHEPLVQAMIADQIGGSNRFIFISAAHGLIIVNEKTGVTTSRFPGCWFSNTYAWTPHAWGVESYRSRAIAWSGWEGGWDGGAYNGLTDSGDDDDARYQRVLERTSKGVNYPKSVVPTVNADDPEEAPSMAGDEKVKYWVGKLFEAADAAKTPDANRFLYTFDNEDEFLAVLPSFYNTAAEAAADLETGLQYLESGVSTFDDVAGWYTLGEIDDDEDTEDGGLADADDNPWVGEVRSLKQIN